MVSDLRRNFVHAGTRAAKVLKLLGPPDVKTGGSWEWETDDGFTRCWYLTVVFAGGRVLTTYHSY